VPLVAKKTSKTILLKPWILLDTDPDAGWIFLVDQLNIHKSESLVRLIAERCGIKADLGIKQKTGLLKSMKTRAAFLSNSNHRIRFIYIPKHTSWLNQIECWCEHLDATLTQTRQLHLNPRP
jgi:hypothetical protein